MGMMFRVIMIFLNVLLSFNIIVTAFSGNAGGTASMMSEIYQTMALSTSIYEMVKIPDKELGFPKPAQLLLKSAESSLGMDSTICVGKPFKELSCLMKAMESVNFPSDEDSFSNIIDDLNDYGRDILDNTQPYEESYGLMTAMKLEELPYDAGSEKKISDRVESFHNIINDMNDYERDILHNTRVEFLCRSKEAISQSRVYIIAIDEKNKRVLVAFRGSQSLLDYYRDVNLKFKKIQDPTSGDSSQLIGVHSGFLDALMGEDFKQVKTGKDAYKYGHVAKTVKCLGLIEQGYRLYVTGHSLGGAMATLFGFFAASDDYFVQNGSVTIYSYASPKVGNSFFGEAFRALELNDRLRHGRIRNSGDVVAWLPYSLGRYKHVGVDVNLMGDKISGKSPEFEFPIMSALMGDTTKLHFVEAPMRGAMGDTMRDTMLFPLKWMMREHSTNLMFDRLKSWREIFEQTTLEQRYQEFFDRHPRS